MNKKATIVLKYACLIFISIFLFACQGNVQENKDCSKCADEIYKEVSDTSLLNSVFGFQKNLLEKFSESSVKGLDHEAYHLQFYSSFGYGKSVKFEHNNGVYSIVVKCGTTKERLDECKEYAIVIDWEDWDKLEKMIYEFDFWTEEDVWRERLVADGFLYILEGNRPEAKKCNKKAYKIIARGSPGYEKMGALCNYIFSFEQQLKLKYEQRYMIR